MLIPAHTGFSRADLENFLARNAAANAFFLGNLAGGLQHSDVQETWVQVAEHGGPIQALCMRYFSIALFYFPQGQKPEISDCAGLIDSWQKKGLVNGMSGSRHCIDAIVENLSCQVRIKPMILATCGADRFESSPSPTLPDEYLLEKAAPPDWGLLDQIMDEKVNIPEFIVRPGAREIFLTGHQNKRARSFAIMHEGRLLSAASSTAENAYSAMIVGVFTLPDYRRRGFAELLIRKITAELLAEGRIPTLFHEDPRAAALYERVGFTQQGEYSLLFF